MNLPVTKHAALVEHICRTLGENSLIFGETAGEIIKRLPESDYKWLYAMIFNNRRTELKNYLQRYERSTNLPANTAGNQVY
jgi:hypothetical protein